jgi:hypothetical protein
MSTTFARLVAARDDVDQRFLGRDLDGQVGIKPGQFVEQIDQQHLQRHTRRVEPEHAGHPPPPKRA